MNGPRSIHRTIDAFYAAASGEQDWAQALHALSDSVDAALILSVAGSGCVSPLLVTARIREEWVLSYVANFHDSDPCVHLVLDAARGVPKKFFNAAGRADLERSRFYRQWMAPQGFISLAATAFLVDGGGDAGRAVLISHQNGSDRAFVVREELIAALLPSLRRALQMWAHRQRAAFLERAARSTIERFPVGVITLDREGTCQTANADACALLGGIGHGGIGPACAADCSHARELARQVRFDNSISRSGSLTNARGEKCRYLVPAADEEHDLTTVFLFPERPQGLRDPAGLQRRYGFTERESEVAVALAGGMTASEIADRLCIGMSAVRTHIRRLLEKTGRTRQTDLVLHLLNDVSGLSGQ